MMHASSLFLQDGHAPTFWVLLRTTIVDRRLKGHTLGLQIGQSRPYLHTLRPKVGIIYIHGAPGICGLA